MLTAGTVKVPVPVLKNMLTAGAVKVPVPVLKVTAVCSVTVDPA